MICTNISKVPRYLVTRKKAFARAQFFKGIKLSYNDERTKSIFLKAISSSSPRKYWPFCVMKIFS